ncbi:Zinc finger CCHC domain-containing protein 10-like [Oopsacas minuta]|uniref:Zinc finger CCHC domain-containing protein 10-like n=1 Tax=Oopsacas minuta TaxID=111878 RepID=A0AAV7K3H1_9METZ|nr:Zinc finger CCHC domain-containing protein 10-like [Oopsacas minuta]
MASKQASRLAQSNLARKKLVQDSSRYKCQKCLQFGHFTFQCTNKRTYSSRVTRSKLLDNKIEENIIEKSKLPDIGIEPPSKKPRVIVKKTLQFPRADDLSDLSSQTSSDTESESSDDTSSISSSSSSTSSSNTIPVISRDKDKHNTS